MARAAAGGPADPAGPDDDPRPLALAALAAAGYAAGLGLAVVGALTVAVWALSPHGDASLESALHVAGIAWLGVNRVPVAVGTGSIGVLPWLFLALPLALLYRAGAWAARASRATSAADAALLLAAVATGYGVAAAVVAVGATTPAAAAVPMHALVVAALVALAGSSPGVVRAAGLWPRIQARVPADAVPVVRGGAAATAALVGAAALVAAVSIALRLPEAADVARALNPGVLGSGVLGVMGAGYAPVAVSWALAYIVGPGVEVGAGTTVSPFANRLGDLPALPWLAGLPDSLPRGAPMLLVLPVLAGVAGGAVLLRGLPGRSAPVVAGDLLGVAAIAGSSAALLAMLSTGGLGPGRLAMAGPSPLLVGVATTGLVLLGAAISVTTETAWRHVKRRSGTA